MPDVYWCCWNLQLVKKVSEKAFDSQMNSKKHHFFVKNTYQRLVQHLNFRSGTIVYKSWRYPLNLIKPSLKGNTLKKSRESILFLALINQGFTGITKKCVNAIDALRGNAQCDAPRRNQDAERPHRGCPRRAWAPGVSRLAWVAPYRI